mgnify:CR=1 FL=1
MCYALEVVEMRVVAHAPLVWLKCHMIHEGGRHGITSETRRMCSAMSMTGCGKESCT